MLLINFFKKASGCLFCLVGKMLMLFLYPSLRKRTLLLLLTLLLSQNQFAQNLDSLLTKAREYKNDSIKLETFNDIAFSYIFNDEKKAKVILEEAISLAKLKNKNYHFTKLINTKGILMDVTGKSDSAGYYFKKANQLSKANKYKDIEIRSTNNLGMYLWNRGDFREAQNYFFEALEMNDKNGDEKTSAKYLNNIGLIYQEMNVNDKALAYHRKSYEIRKKYNLLKEQGASLNNIGICLKDLNRPDEAMIAYNEGLEVCKASKNFIDYYKILENIASIYFEQDNLILAKDFYLKALLKTDEMPKNEKGDLVINGKLVGVFNSLKKPKTGLNHVLKGEQILEKFPHYLSYAEDLMVNASESYFMLDNDKKGKEYLLRFIDLKNKMFTESNAKAMADFEVKYETEKKEKQILIQRADLAERDLVIQKRNYQIYGLLGLALILGLLGYLFYNQQKLKNNQLKKENELKDALVKIETQNKLQEQRLRISRDLHDNIGAQLTFIISSIDNLKYGFDIKDKKLTNKLETISDFTSETIYELRDTIWAMNKDEINIEDLETRILNYMEKARKLTSKCKFQFNIDNNVDYYKNFSSVKGMNIYRIIQEAVHNSLKYANASEIAVRISQNGNQIIFEVIDDGCGFDINSVKRGNGLTNMKKRSRDIDAEFQIVSQEQHGTKISLTLV